MISKEILQSIEIVRTNLNHKEIFDLIIVDADIYYRNCLIVDKVNKQVELRTNIEGYKEEPVFEIETSNIYIDALAIETELIFQNLVLDEFDLAEESFDLEVSVLNIDELTSEFNKIMNDLDSRDIENMSPAESESVIKEFEDRLEDVQFNLDSAFVGEKTLQEIVDFNNRKMS